MFERAEFAKIKKCSFFRLQKEKKIFASSSSSINTHSQIFKREVVVRRRSSFFGVSSPEVRVVKAFKTFYSVLVY